MAYKVNKNFFNLIDTEEKAYWLGFITADGCVYKNILFIRLNSKDKNHLLKFKSHIESEHPIYNNISNYNTEISSLQIGNKYICEKLKDFNVVPNKSYTITPPIFLDEEIEKSYWRGVFDGDGSVQINKKGYLVVGMCGNEPMIDGFFKFLNKNSIKFGSKEKCTDQTFKYKTVGKKAPLSILNLLYDGAHIYLDRKYSLYEAYKKRGISPLTFSL